MNILVNLLNQLIPKNYMKKKSLMARKGISPLIATVLLIGLVVILALIFFLFLREQIAAQTQKIECGAQEQLNVDISATCGPNENGGTVVTLNNVGAETIDGIRIVCTESSGGATSPPSTLINCKTGEQCDVSYNLNCAEVEVLPGVVIEREDQSKFSLCTDKSVKVQCSV